MQEVDEGFRKLNVLQVISSGGFFGAENVVLQLAGALKGGTGFTPWVTVLNNLWSPHTEVIAECEKRGIRNSIIPCKGKLDLRAVAALRSFVIQNNISVIHSHGYKANLYSYLASVRKFVPLVATCHNWPGKGAKMEFYASLDRFLLRRFDQVVAVSEEVSRKLVRAGVSDRKVHVIRNGISSEPFQIPFDLAEVKKGLGIHDGGPVVGTVGHLTPVKGHRILLTASREALKEFPSARVLVIGDGPIMEELKTDFNDEHFVFAGFRNDMPQVYRCMDLFVLPSLTEGLPMALLEAMASGLPVIASRVGSIPEVIQEGENGLMIDPGDAETLGKYIVMLLRNQEEMKRMGRNGRERVETHFSSATMATEYVSIYKEVYGKELRQ